MPDRATSLLDEADAALGAVTDLLCHITQDDLHCVSPARLYCLLELVRGRLHLAREEMCRSVAT